MKIPATSKLFVTPAKAGVQLIKSLDSRFRGNDGIF